MKKKFILILSCIIILSTQFVFSTEDFETPDGIKSQVEGYGSSEDIDKQNLDIDIKLNSNSNKHISFTQATLQDIGDQVVHITSRTITIDIVDQLRLKVYLEVWTGDSWSTIKSWSDSISNEDSHSFSKLYSVKQNNYYRVRATHTVIHDGSSESESTITSYILIK
ncbi:DUF6147 family protein [Alkaliphilus serpentinus]|uniref:Uncharacterized protein n=1 Tax=Alkaliphilus serpentinus TaxID=1482731 RepID=A0A833HLD7_9FIRM|nr:DUF6147 family protein [Alkaliphilus serpentinus]KAB3525667.1 hypothetical protein F8153_14830 [Alkaliphilus serpentinus]